MKKPIYQILYVQVLFAVACGILLGKFYPELGVKMEPLGKGFVDLVKMIIAPIIFCTVVTGIAGMENLKKVGRVGGKALLYFEVVSTIALAIGLIVINIWQPGIGMNADASKLDTKATAKYVTAAAESHGGAAPAPVAAPAPTVASAPAVVASGVQAAASSVAVAASTVVKAPVAAAKKPGEGEFLLKIVMDIIPNSVVGAFAKGDILQVLLFSVLFGFALAKMGEKAKLVTTFIDQFSHGLFGVVAIIMKVAPIGAFGAMAFTISKLGVASLGNLLQLMGSFYLTCLLFVFVVLGIIAKLAGFSIFKFVAYIKEELLIVLGTSSSESALPRMIAKMEKLGCSKSVVGLVIPTGYSFNLDGTAIYLTMAAIFIAQATNTPLDLAQQLTILSVLMITSKGASGVTGSGFIVLAATLAAVPTIPVAGMALILGIDRFMSEARALTNLVGNGVATIVVSRWEKELDHAKLTKALNDGPAVEDELENVSEVVRDKQLG